MAGRACRACLSLTPGSRPTLRFASFRSASLRFETTRGPKEGGGARSFRHLAPAECPHGPSTHPLLHRELADRQAPNKCSPPNSAELLIYDTGLKVPAPPSRGVGATFFKGTTRHTYALHPEVSGRPTRPTRNGPDPTLPPGHTPIWAILYSPVLGREIRCIFRCGLRSLFIVINSSQLGP